MLTETPGFLPRRTGVGGFERDDAVRRELTRCTVGVADEQCQQTRQVREVADDQNIARLGAQPVPHPGRRVVRLEILGRGELCERVAGPPERLRGLTRAQLATMPDDIWRDVTLCRECREAIDGSAPDRRQRPPRVDLRSDRRAVMNQVETQGCDRTSPGHQFT
jgi:hypothetical protein